MHKKVQLLAEFEGAFKKLNNIARELRESKSSITKLYNIEI